MYRYKDKDDKNYTACIGLISCNLIFASYFHNLDHCCSEFELDWSQKTIIKAGLPMASPVGVYKKQFIVSSNTTVYHNRHNGFYLHKINKAWVVRKVYSRKHFWKCSLILSSNENNHWCNEWLWYLADRANQWKIVSDFLQQTLLWFSMPDCWWMCTTLEH